MFGLNLRPLLRQTVMFLKPQEASDSMGGRKLYYDATDWVRARVTATPVALETLVGIAPLATEYTRVLVTSHDFDRNEVTSDFRIRTRDHREWEIIGISSLGGCKELYCELASREAIVTE